MLQKSRWVRLYGIWLHPYQSLGLRLYSPYRPLTQLFRKVLGLSPTLKLTGWTRGRGSNPSTGKPPTTTSRLPLEDLVSHSPSKLSVELLVGKYKTYFGLILSRLYGCSSTLPTSSSLSLSTKRGSLLSSLQKLRRKNPEIKLNLDLYNSGVKYTEYFLKLNHNEPIPLEAKIVNPNLERELKIAWKNNSADITTLELPRGLPLNQTSSCSDSFKKYSELKLSPEEYNHLKKLYESSRDQ